jgi:hypothetical protein
MHLHLITGQLHVTAIAVGNLNLGRLHLCKPLQYYASVVNNPWNAKLKPDIPALTLSSDPIRLSEFAQLHMAVAHD